VRVGAVDLGTNSTRLLIADVDDGAIREVRRGLRITRLGERVDTRRILLPTAVARVRNVLTDYRRELESLGAERTLAVATSAVRDAENGEAFLGEIEWSYGFETRLLSGDEEASLTHRGVASGRPIDPRTLIVDIGGGSTELILPDRHVSLDVGCVRLTERFGDDADAAGASVAVVLPDWPVEGAIGVAGTVTSLAALDLGLVDYDPELVHGHVLSTAAVEEQLERLTSLPLEQRRALPGLEPERAPVIVAGAAILRAVLRRYRLDSIEASEHDLLHGVALLAAELPGRDEAAAPPGTYTCC
jgi:exopolyphosphatase / guanosine-5'-triphosphate,3'-diphosphate pyrophosphatase